jgi:hypothetical protein
VFFEKKQEEKEWKKAKKLLAWMQMGRSLLRTVLKIRPEESPPIWARRQTSWKDPCMRSVHYRIFSPSI